MSDQHPPELAQLFAATDLPTHDAAWAAFVTTHSRLLLHTARSLNHDHDAAMDGYAYVLEALRADGYRRLRAFAADGRGKFSTWLVVVARRLCLDFHRKRYGRARDVGPESREVRAARRRLVDLVGDEVDPAELTRSGTDPAVELQASERGAVLEATISALPASDRLLLTLRFEDDLSAREIAQVMGFATPFHVYRRLNALLAEMRNVLRRRGVDEL
jgi:RNA polymerase sigma factor (sigma-70 family)